MDGMHFSLATDSNGVTRFRVPFGLYTMTISYLGDTQQVVPSTFGSHSYTISFLLSYPLLVTIAGATALTCIFIFFRLRMRRRSDAEPYYYFADS
jgi:hypothetical protein